MVYTRDNLKIIIYCRVKTQAWQPYINDIQRQDFLFYFMNQKQIQTVAGGE